MSTTVGELIKFLQQFYKDTPVAYQCYSEYLSLDIKEIQLRTACAERIDGWIAEARPDKPQTTYLVFPGN